MNTLLLSLLASLPIPQEPVTVAQLAGPELAPLTLLIEDLDLSVIEQEWDRARKARSVDDNPLRIGGVEFTHGFGSHAFGEAILDLGGAAHTFQAAVGLDDEVGERGTVVFVVIGDEQELARSPLMRGGAAAHVFDVDVSDVEELVLVARNGGDGINYDHADWGGARLLLHADAAREPTLVAIPDDPAPDILRAIPDAPAIHAPRIVGSTPSRPFLFRIPTSGKRPLVFTAEGLPAGLELDAATGILTGSLQAEGRFMVAISVDGPAGHDESALTIVGGEHALALTPPMGWNSWNVWGLAVDDAKVRAAADWLERSGLADHGFSTINIDDGWEGERDEHGVLQPNDKFPDMRALSDYVHSKGLKLGIYSSPGELTCGGYAGSLGYEEIDARTWAEWGIDYLKYDWCSYGRVAVDHSRAELEKPYHVMRAALDAVGRDIVYSLCQYGMGEVSTWGANVGGNLWRTTGDITDSWSSMTRIGFDQAGLEAHAEPGHWNDPDMLVVGRLGWGPSLHDTRLSPNELITHISLWSLLASPLLIGCDLTAIDDFTQALLTNAEVLEINQDPLGSQARRVVQEGDTEVWARPLEDGSHAVGLFNRGRRTATMQLEGRWLGIEGALSLRDVWLHEDLGETEGTFSVEVPRHGVLLLRVRGLSR